MFRKPTTKKDKKLLEAIRKLPCAACRKHGPSDASHVRSRGAGGPDTVWNVFPHCRDCHIEWHRVGWKCFLERHPTFAFRLLGAGWIIDPDLIGLWHPELGAKDDA